MEMANRFLQSLEEGNFVDSNLMQTTFGVTFSKVDLIELRENIKFDSSTPGYRPVDEDVRLTAPFVLWTPDNKIPFSVPIKTIFGSGGDIRFYYIYADRLSKCDYIIKDLRKQIPDIQQYYKENLQQLAK